jgi:hypothetical protein
VARPAIKIDYAQVKQLAARGLSKHQIAISLNMSEDTLERREKDNREFLQAMEEGRTESVKAVSDALYQKALDPKGPVLANIYWLKVMGGPMWRQDQHYNHHVDGEVDVQVSAASENEQMRRALRNMTQEERDIVRRSLEIQEEAARRISRPAIETTATQSADEAHDKGCRIVSK